LNKKSAQKQKQLRKKNNGYSQAVVLVLGGELKNQVIVI